MKNSDVEKCEKLIALLIKQKKPIERALDFFPKEVFDQALENLVVVKK